MTPAIPLVAAAVSSAPAMAVANRTLITVGPGADYEDVAQAINSISDNSENNPYLIKVLPGIYSANWSVKEWVSIEGSGPLATIFEGSEWGCIRIAQSNVSLSNFGMRFTTTKQQQAAILRTGPATCIYVSQVHIELAGSGVAIRNRGGGAVLTWWLRDIKLRTEGIGLDLGGQNYCDDLKVFMHGSASGHPHIGCRVMANYARIYLNNCRIGTGYGWEYQNGFIPNDVSGDDDVIGIWIPEGYSESRVEIHGLESFCRNNDTTNPLRKVNVIRTESAWVRTFGCFGQAETPADWSIRKTLYRSGKGKIEQYACRFSGVSGDSFGSNLIGVQTYTYENDGHMFSKFECGLHRLDATAAAFTLILEWPDSAVAGEVHIFKKVDGVNPVTIDLNGATLEGSPGDVVLNNQYEELRLVWDGGEWLRA